MKFVSYIHTDCGMREHNEDYAGYRIRPWRFGVWAVADGLGGHDAGEIAAYTATKSMIEAFTNEPNLMPEHIEKIFSIANEAVRSKQGRENGFYSMKTTLAAAFYRRGKICFAHVGDSRIYLFRKSKLIYQTLDHSIPQLAVSQGKLSPDDIRGHNDRNQILRAIGSSFSKATVTGTLRLKSGDAFLICTDGFWENVLEQCMEDTLSISHSPEQWVTLMLHQHKKKQSEGQDNHTALAVFVR